MRIIPLDASRFTGKRDAHEYIASALNFPDYYGHNLDALADCLYELPRDTAVIIRNSDICGEYAKQVIKVFCEVLKKCNRVLIIT